MPNARSSRRGQRHCAPRPNSPSTILNPGTLRRSEALESIYLTGPQESGAAGGSKGWLESASQRHDHDVGGVGFPTQSQRTMLTA